MRGARLWQTLRLFSIPSSKKRTQYLREKGIFFDIGENCSIMSRIVPLYAKLIKIGNNVHIASKVNFVTHDVSHVMLNAKPDLKDGEFQERIGCIEIQDNVFVGAGTTILYNVRIGSNVVIGAGSLVNKDIPSNSVVAGVPARIIESFEEFINKRKDEMLYPLEMAPRKEAISDEVVVWCWKHFEKLHQ